MGYFRLAILSHVTFPALVDAAAAFCLRHLLPYVDNSGITLVLITLPMVPLVNP